MTYNVLHLKSKILCLTPYVILKPLFRYDFLIILEKTGGKEPLNKVDLLEGAGNMPGKWQLLIYLGQQAILQQQTAKAADCS